MKQQRPLRTVLIATKDGQILVERQELIGRDFWFCVGRYKTTHPGTIPDKPKPWMTDVRDWYTTVTASCEYCDQKPCTCVIPADDEGVEPYNRNPMFSQVAYQEAGDARNQ